MSAPHAPIIIVHQGDDAVGAFFTVPEVVDHLSKDHELRGDDLGEWRFFDARGRELDTIVGTDGALQGLAVHSEDSHADRVRERVRRRSAHVREALEDDPLGFGGVDRSPLTLADEEDDFQAFARRLADALRPGRGPFDPPIRDSRGWWHNTFCH